MSSSDPTSLIILSEVVLIESCILIGIFVFSILKKRKRSKMLKDILNSVSSEQELRKQALKSAFQKSGMDDESLNSAVTEIIEKEVSFYQYITSLLHTGKKALLMDMVSEMDKLVKPYENLAHQDQSKDDTDTSTEAENGTSAEDAINDLLDGDGIEEAQEENEISDPSLDLSNTSDVDDIPEDLLLEDEPEEEITDTEKEYSDKGGDNKE